jgi:imidazolonepropionase-like amidohydrolase
MVASRIAAAHVPVIVEPMTNLPTRFSTLHTRYENAAILSQAGVQIVLMAPGAWDVRNLRQEAGNAVAYGMDRGLALAAITSAPAAVFGMDADYGTVAPGRLANLVVWSGDPFEMTSVARRVFVRGREMPLRSRQTMLLERYRSLGVVARGYRGIPAADPMPSGEGDAVGVP